MAYDLRSMLRFEEGVRHEAYPDPKTGGEPVTIGIGHASPGLTLDLVWTDEQIEAAFEADIAEATGFCEHHFPWFRNMNDPRQAVLISMVFQMGGRVLGFHDALAAMRDEHWATAAMEMLDSQWGRSDSPKRARRAAHQMETGQWQ